MVGISKVTNCVRVGGFVSCAALFLSACSSELTQWEPDKKRPVVYSVSFRQTAPQSTYKRTKWVNFPDLLPDRMLPDRGEAVIQPIFHLTLKNSSLEEAALVLASTERYTSSCNSSKCSNKVTVDALGTIEELASELTKKSGVLFQVDHGARAVRVGGIGLVSPKFESKDPSFYKDSDGDETTVEFGSKDS